MATEYFYKRKSKNLRGTKGGITTKMVHHENKIPNKIIKLFHHMAKFLIDNAGNPATPVLQHIQEKIGNPLYFHEFSKWIFKTNTDHFSFKYWMRSMEDSYYSTVSVIDGIIVINNRFLCPNDIQKEKSNAWGYYPRVCISFNGKSPNRLLQTAGIHKNKRKQLHLSDKQRKTTELEFLTTDKLLRKQL